MCAGGAGRYSGGASDIEVLGRKGENILHTEGEEEEASSSVASRESSTPTLGRSGE